MGHSCFLGPQLTWQPPVSWLCPIQGWGLCVLMRSRAGVLPGHAQAQTLRGKCHAHMSIWQGRSVRRLRRSVVASQVCVL